MPRTSGSSVPTVRPKLWNKGKELNIRSLSITSMTAIICCTFAMRLRVG